MSENKTRVTVRLPDDALDTLRDELDSCYTDSARFQFVVQFYLDYKALGGLPQSLQAIAGRPCHEPSMPEQTHARDQNPNTDTGSHRNRPASDETHSDSPSFNH